MRQLQWLALLTTTGMCFGVGCQFLAELDNEIVYVPDTSSSSSGMGGSAGSGGMMTTSTGGMGGMGGGGSECMTLSDCKSNECKAAMFCNGGTCVWQFIFIYTVVDSQLYGDCLDRVCDGQGNVMFVDTSADPTQWYKWNNPCYADACNAIAMPMANDGAMCTTHWNKAGLCQNFKCVECLMNEDCASGACSPDGRCVLPTCYDAAQTGGESDIDCGGLNCAPCGEGKACTSDLDCTGKCENMVCSAPSCSDGILNQDETDIDCGGSCAMEATPKKCAAFARCLFPGDCSSSVCKNGQCQEPSCLDQTKNWDEAGIDCGGGCPYSCP